MSNPEMSAERRSGREPLETGDDGRAELKHMLDTISAQLQDADRRHTAALNEMQDRISGMGREAALIGNRIPDQFAPAFEQIRAGIGELAHRLADTGDGEHVFHASERRRLSGPNLSHRAGTPGGDEPDTAEPWDHQSAEALADVYEAAAADYAAKRKGATARERDEGSSRINEAWLESRFAEIARGIDYSLAHMKPESPTSDLGNRFDEFERQFGKLFAGVATHEDFAAVRKVEAHINDVANQLEQTQDQLMRLNTIEAQIASISKTLAEMQSSQSAAKFTSDIDAIARQAAEESAQRFIETRGSQEPSAAYELRQLIQQLMTENRQSDEHTAILLDTLQQAMVRLLDRVDAIDAARLPGQLAFEAAPPAKVSGEDLYGSAVQGEDWISRGYEGSPDLRGGFSSSPVATPPPPFAEPERTAFSADEAAHRSERLRQEFVADARRARTHLSGDDNDVGAGASVSFSSSAAMSPHSGSRPIRPPASPAKNTLGPSAPSPRLMLLAGLVLVALAALWYTLPFGGKPSEPAATHQLAPERLKGSQDGSDSAPGNAAPATGEQGAPPSNINGPRGEADPQGGHAQKAASLDAGARPATALPMMGVAVDIGQPISVEEMQTARRHQAMAAMSGELGDAAARPGESPQVPKSMVPTEGETEGVTAPDRTSASVSGGAKSSSLDLPAATIGPLSLRLAAAKGDPSAEFEVGARFAAGEGVAQNFLEAAKWYQRSADQGFAQAEYRLGTLYERGLGLKPDRGQATLWYERAARHGNVNAMHNLAVLSANQLDQSPDYTTAAQWFEEAAKHGLPDSQFNLAVLYENGLGVGRDLSRAYLWVSLAARQGDGDAVRRKESIRGKLTAQEVAQVNKMVDSWRPLPTDRSINDALAAGELWKKNPKNGVTG
jgi:localization factor PodJL